MQQNQAVKDYNSPKLKVYGSVRNLTGGSNGPQNGDAGAMKF